MVQPNTTADEKRQRIFYGDFGKLLMLDLTL
jgi:hypothetical protein